MPKKFKTLFAAEVLNVASVDALKPVPAPTNSLKFRNSSEKEPSVEVSNDNYPGIILQDTTSFIINNHGLQNPSFNSDVNLLEDKPIPPDDPYIPSKIADTGEAWVYSGCKFDLKLIGRNSKFHDLGLFSEKDLESLGDTVTIRRFRTFAAAASLNIFAEVYITLKPKDPAQTIAPYGKSYTTYIPYAARISLNKIRSILIKWTFQFGSTEAPIVYIIEPGSIHPRKLRAYEPI
jgi:hypothetical protein